MASTAAMLGMLFTAFAERYDGRLDAASIEACRRFVEGAATWNVPPESPRTLQHGDYRLDNMLFGDGVHAPELAVVDWQTIVRGHAMADVAYFMGSSLEPAEREACEVDLVRGYHDRMRAAGVDGWSWDDCWRDYRYFSFFGLMMGIGASMLVEQTERGDEMFITNVRRAAAHVEAMEAFSLVEVAA
jgi:aminoglycoside phosphotransferase (APT) family kinase protein